MRFLSALPVIFAVAACSSGGNQPCTLTGIGHSCQQDTECCTGYCMLEGAGAYCQEKPGTPQACVQTTGFCTQDRNCCSGLCQSNQCFGGGVSTSCLAIGSPCTAPDSCCSVNCIADTQGGTACAPQPQSDGGLACGLPGAPCSLAGQPDPSECCFGICGSNGQCSGTTGGGGGSNCKGSGGYCQYGADCCSQICEKVSSGYQCK